MSLERLNICADIINKKHKDYSLLDAGCRTMALKPLLKGCSQYFGSDLIAAEGVLECNLEEKLPFNNKQFDVVTVLDVLEHLNNPHQALQELVRVAKKTLIVSLPNMYYIEFRLRFLLGNGISGKYKFPIDPCLDRHRWILSYEEAVNFMQHNLQPHPITHQMILPARGRSKFFMQPLEKCLATHWPNLFAYGVIFEINLEK